MSNIKEKKKEIFTKSGTGSGKGIGGSGGDVDVSGTEGNGGKDSVAGLGEAVEEKGVEGKRKKKLIMNIQEWNCSKESIYVLQLFFELFHSKVLLLIGKATENLLKLLLLQFLF